MKRCGISLFPENKKLFHKPPLRSLAVPDQNTRIIIPVIFHVVGNSTVQNSTTDSRLEDQIKQMNQDFSMTNSDIENVPIPFVPWLPQSATIKFELKQIVRKTTSVSSFQANSNNICQDSIKLTSLGGSDSIDTENNLNAWIGNIYDQSSYDLLGYAYFPWFRDEGSCYANTDGVVAHYETIGSTSNPNPSTILQNYSRGRTMTHEVGHYLGFRHMWNDCDETVCCRAEDLDDLPAQKGPNEGSPIFPHRANSCPASSTSPSSQHGDMFMNYMDYVYDTSMCMFSQSQMDLAMQMCLQYRSGLVKQFKSTSTSELNLTDLNSSNNNDIYKCVVINENGSIVLESDSVRAITD